MWSTPEGGEQLLRARIVGRQREQPARIAKRGLAPAQARLELRERELQRSDLVLNARHPTSSRIELSEIPGVFPFLRALVTDERV